MSSRTSYEKTANAQIMVGGLIVSSCLVITDGTNDAVVNLYDVAASADAAAGNKIFQWTTTGTSNQDGRNWFEPVQLKKGLWATVSGTGASYIVEYRKA